MAKKKSTLAAALLLTALIALIFGSYYSYLSEGVIYSIVNSDIDSVVNYIDSFGALASLILLLLVVLEVVLAPIPPLLLYLAAGIIFGTLFGGFLVLLGNLIGAAIAFIIARTFGERFVSGKISKERKECFNSLTEKYGFFAIFLLRINPLTSSDIFSYIAGLSKMKISKFLLSTALGLAPLVFIQTYFGSDLIRSNPTLLIIFIMLSLAYIAAFIYILFYSILKRK
ncbi:MAG: VTT domain-containing protein [archaeon]